jgi:alpha-glucosidase/alpha-D-xyloside xylohydrolase
MREYAKLTGLPFLPPLWSLGYQQSHRTLLGREAILEIADTLRAKKLPADALIYLGTGYASSGWNVKNGEFEFNDNAFPSPARDIRALQEKNFKVVLHVTEAPPRLYGSVADPVAPAGDRNAIKNYWARHQPVSKLGVDGWWPDLGEQLSHASRIARNRMYWDGSLLDHPNERPYALNRTGYAGMQRYGWLWSGDIYSNWQVYRDQVPVGITTSMSGIPYWGTDIGGFYSTPEFSGELFVRWFQFGSFTPLFRSHGVPSYLHFPWSWNSGSTGPQELWDRPGLGLPDPSELHNAQVEPICRKYMELRYRLLPYLYSLARETHETGLPLMRALWLHYGDDPAAAARGTEYLWGRDMLVAPVLEKGATRRTLYLPRGEWYDFWTESKIQGGREISREVDLETMPLYVRAGAILPMGPVKQHTEEQPDTPLTLAIYPGADGRFDLYEDDGKTMNFQAGEFMKIRCQWNDGARRLELALVDASKMLGPARRTITVRMAPGDQTRSVVFEGKPVSVSF